MSRIPPAKIGEKLLVKGRPIPFSSFPVVRNSRRYGLQSRIFATNPWGIIRQSIEENCKGITKNQAFAFLDQSEYFYKTAIDSNLIETKPLLFYYCFLNLVKAFCLKKNIRELYSKAQHGIQEEIHPGGVEFKDSFLKVFRSKAGKTNIFDDFQKALLGSGLPNSEKVFNLKNLLPQLLQGHRVWCAAGDEDDRFIEITRIDYINNEADKNIWLILNIYSDDLSRFGISRKNLLAKSGLGSDFKEVFSNETIDGRKLLKFEQKTPLHYTGRAADKIAELVNIIRGRIWTTVLKIPPYRKHYLYLSPPEEKDDLLNQLLSIYAVFYYLGSVTRYRPEKFEEIFSSNYGAHIQEIISNIPQQFLYLIASEFAQREISHAPIV